MCKHTPSSGGFLAARARVYSKAEDPNESLFAANASTKVLQPQVHHLVELGADPHQNVTAIKSQYLLNLQNLQTHKTQARKGHGHVQHNPQGPLIDPESAMLSARPSVSLRTHHTILILPLKHRHSTCLANAPPARLMLDLATPLS